MVGILVSLPFTAADIRLAAGDRYLMKILDQNGL
jgi:hypothetical protein